MALEEQEPDQLPPSAELRDQPNGRHERTSPSKVLPTDRIAFPKQLELLKAYAAASTPPGRVVSNRDVADVIQMKASTVSLANSFLVDTGLIIKTDGGFLPSEAVIEFFRSSQWNNETPARKLSQALRDTWFSQALLPKLALRSLTEREAVQFLADASSASPRHQRQLMIILNFLEASGLVERDGNQIKAPKIVMVPSAQPRVASVESHKAQEHMPASPPKPPTVATFAQATEGTVNFNISVRAEMKEFAGWSPERISAFFSGIAQVLAAKAGLEKDEK